PTHTHPPSLHDALPISTLSGLSGIRDRHRTRSRDHRRPRREHSEGRGALPLFLQREQRARLLRKALLRARGGTTYAEERSTAQRDRKSTRLNSSHVSIS